MRRDPSAKDCRVPVSRSVCFPSRISRHHFPFSLGNTLLVDARSARKEREESLADLYRRRSTFENY